MYYFLLPSAYSYPSCDWSLQLLTQTPSPQLKPQDPITNYAKNCFTPTVLLNPTSNEQPSSASESTKIRKHKIPQECETFHKDGDYRPIGAEVKKSKKSKQLQNRNVVPNIIRLILSFIQKRGKSQSLVERLGKSQSENFSSSRYYLWQKLIRGKLNNYVNEDTLKRLTQTYPEEIAVYPLHEQLLYTRVTTILISHFLTEEVYLCTLTSKRMEKAKKHAHLQAIRMIHHNLRRLLAH